MICSVTMMLWYSTLARISSGVFSCTSCFEMAHSLLASSMNSGARDQGPSGPKLCLLSHLVSMSARFSFDGTFRHSLCLVSVRISPTRKATNCLYFRWSE
uniref:(northern house mosquito) hypothetical protein n=1 Tax=Culex pipiens TaxID=7175 RepID=A0A8D8C2Z8_CULPI